MTKERYNEIKERNKENKLLLCFEVFREEKKGNMGVEQFRRLLSEWLVMQQPDVFIFSGGDSEQCLNAGIERIVEHLNLKYA